MAKTALGTLRAGRANARAALNSLSGSRPAVARGVSDRQLASMRQSINTALGNPVLAGGNRMTFVQLRNMSDAQLREYMRQNPSDFDVFFDYP